MEKTKEENRPLPFDEIQKETGEPRSKLNQGNIPIPTGVGNTGISLGKKQHSRDDTEDVPDGATVGARVK